MSDKLSVNLGYVYENMIAQMLTVNGHALYYYTFLNEKTNHNYEIDFLISKKNKLCPIEVKSSGYNVHKSLDAFSEKYSGRILEKYLIAYLLASVRWAGMFGSALTKWKSADDWL